MLGFMILVSCFFILKIWSIGAFQEIGPQKTQHDPQRILRIDVRVMFTGEFNLYFKVAAGVLERKCAKVCLANGKLQCCTTCRSITPIQECIKIYFFSNLQNNHVHKYCATSAH